MVGHDLGGSPGPVIKIRRIGATMAFLGEIQEKERRVREFLKAKGSPGSPPEAAGQFFVADRGRPQPRGNHDRGGGRLPPHHRKGEVRDLQQYRVPPDGGGGETGGAGLRIPIVPVVRESGNLPWSREIVGPGSVGCDVPFPDAVVLTEEIARLRYSLTADELTRYRWLGEWSPQPSSGR